MAIVALIPARGGSQRVLRKNVKLCAGKPLIAYTCEAARDSRFLTRTLVSTDTEEIATVARSFGAEVPFLRPEHLSGSEVPMLPVIQHALAWCESQRDAVEAIVLLQPTSPLRQTRHIDEAIELFRQSGADSVVSVCEVPEHVHPRKLLRVENGMVLKAIPDAATDGELYLRNGPVVIVSRPDVIRAGSIYGERSVPYVMEWSCSLDVNDPFDFEVAEALLERRS